VATIVVGEGHVKASRVLGAGVSGRAATGVLLANHAYLDEGVKGADHGVEWDGAAVVDHNHLKLRSRIIEMRQGLKRAL
jgi:hypothetical protein